MKNKFVWLSCLAVASLASAQAAAVLSVSTTDKELAIASKGGPVTYKAVVDRLKGGDIRQFCLPASSAPVAGDLTIFFFYGAHGEDYTLRGWTSLDRCILASSAEVLSQQPDEIVVQVNVDAAGTFEFLSKDPAVRASVMSKYKSFKEKTVKIKRLYTFKPDRIEVSDEVLWVFPNMKFESIEWAGSFKYGASQSPARLVKGDVKASFYPVNSHGEKVPKGISYPFTAETFLKNGYKVSLLTKDTSFDIHKSNIFHYEKPWQTEWSLVPAFQFDLSGQPQDKPMTLKHEWVFAKATPAEMPPVITLRSPGSDARFMDEKGEVGKCKLGEPIKLAASAVNADGTPVADKNISWEVYASPLRNRKPVVLQGAQATCTLPLLENDKERDTVQKWGLLAVIKVIAKGNNGTQATEHFAMLIAK